MPSQTRDHHHHQHFGSLKPSTSLLSLCSQKTDEKENKIAPRPYHSLRKKGKSKRSSILDGCWNGTTTAPANAQSSASLFNSSLNGSLLTEDFMWTSFQPNYINMMNDTNLMEECNEANLELQSNISSSINSAEKLFKPLHTAQNGSQKRKWSPSDQMNDAPKLLHWITYMENYLTAVAPSFSEIRKMNNFELQARLKEHIRIRQYIAVHSKSVTKFVRISQELQHGCDGPNVINITELENRYLNLLLKAIEIQCALEELPDSGRDSQCSSSDDNNDNSQINVKLCRKKILITSSSDSINHNGDISDFEELSDESTHEAHSKFKMSQHLHTNGMQSSITSFTYSSLSQLPTTNNDDNQHSNDNNGLKSSNKQCSSSELSGASFKFHDNKKIETLNNEIPLENSESIKKWLNGNNSCSDTIDNSTDECDIDDNSNELLWDDFQMLYPKSDSPYSSDVAVQTSFSLVDIDNVSTNNLTASDQSTIIENDILIDADENFDTLKPSDFVDIAEVCQKNVECLQKVLCGEIGKRCQQSKYFKLNIRQFGGNNLLAAAADKSHEWCIVEKKCRCSKISRFLTRVVDFVLDFTNFIKKFNLYKCLVNLIRKLYDAINFVGNFVKFGSNKKQREILQPTVISEKIAANIESTTKVYMSTDQEEKSTKTINNNIIDGKLCKTVDISEICQTNVDYLQKLLQTDLEKKLHHLNGFKLILKNVDEINSVHEICVVKTKCKCLFIFRLLIRLIDVIVKFSKYFKNFLFYTFFMYPKRKICQLLNFLTVRIRVCCQPKIFVKCL